MSDSHIANIHKIESNLQSERRAAGQEFGDHTPRWSWSCVVRTDRCSRHDSNNGKTLIRPLFHFSIGQKFGNVVRAAKLFDVGNVRFVLFTAWVRGKDAA